MKKTTVMAEHTAVWHACNRGMGVKLQQIQIQIQNQFVTRRSVQAKKRNRRRERRLLMGIVTYVVGYITHLCQWRASCTGTEAEGGLDTWPGRTTAHDHAVVCVGEVM